MWYFTLAILILGSGVHRSCSLAVQATRIPLRARGQPTGATLEAISNVNLTHTADRVDFRASHYIPGEYAQADRVSTY
jgi:hypothetical protein